MAKQAKKEPRSSRQDDVFATALTWETDRVVELRRSARCAWYVAATACFVAVLGVGAVAGLTPLKHVEPFVIRVDKSTGIVDVVSGIKRGPSTYAEAVTRYFAARYIRAREGYTRALASTYYKRVGLMSAERVAKQYFAAFNPNNPRSPLRVYGATGRVQAEIVSISFLAKDVLSIRFKKSVKYDNRPPAMTHWIATMKFRYSKAPMHESDRLINPLGFQVLEYRVAPEVVGETRR